MIQNINAYCLLLSRVQNLQVLLCEFRIIVKKFCSGDKNSQTKMMAVEMKNTVEKQMFISRNKNQSSPLHYKLQVDNKYSISIFELCDHSKCNNFQNSTTMKKKL